MKRSIRQIIIHCSASPNGRAITIADVDAGHKKRGFRRDSQACRSFNPSLKSVGYHFFIEPGGKISTGRSLEEIGAHVQGSNKDSIGICMGGTDKFDRFQWESLRNLLIKLAGDIKGVVMLQVEKALNAYNEMRISIKGHRDYSPDLNGDGQITRSEWFKTCPGFEVATFLKDGLIPKAEWIC